MMIKTGLEHHRHDRIWDTLYIVLAVTYYTPYFRYIQASTLYRVGLGVAIKGKSELPLLPRSHLTLVKQWK